MGRPWHLPADEVGRLAAHLRDQPWDWTAPGLDGVLGGVRWHVAGREPDGPVVRLASLDAPALRGLAAVLDPGDGVVDIVLNVSEAADELDPDGQAGLDGIAERLAASLSEVLGVPDRYEGGWPVWSGAVGDVSLRRNRGRVAIAAEHRANLARFRGEDPPPEPERRPAPRPAGGDGAWAAVASGLGRLLVALDDLDRVSFAVGEPAVLAVTRDGADVWLVATGPDDEVEPVPLSPEQLAALRAAGFARPLADRAERAPQRHSWWYRLRLPADALVLESAGHALVAAARQVYGAEHPSDLVWFGMGLSAGGRRVLDSLDITRSDFQRG